MLSVKAGNEVPWINKADAHTDGNVALISWSAKEVKGNITILSIIR